MPAASLIVSTYNQPVWLEKVLWSLEEQSCTDFEVVIADDGSGEATDRMLEAFRRSTRLAIQRVWHPDEGFRKTEILNRAILAAQSDYLIFTDGDCLLRADFVATHLRLSRPRTFLSGGYYKLTRPVSERIGRADIREQRCFRGDWLHAQGQPRSLKDLKLTPVPALAHWLNRLTPTRPSWNGHNASTWKKHILDANGFDVRMKYGGEDREFGERLRHAGIAARQIRYSAICLHLDHDRGYVRPEMIEHNREIWEDTRRTGARRTAHGIAT